jgi:hypothetical protein
MIRNIQINFRGAHPETVWHGPARAIFARWVAARRSCQNKDQPRTVAHGVIPEVGGGAVVGRLTEGGAVGSFRTFHPVGSPMFRVLRAKRDSQLRIFAGGQWQLPAGGKIIDATSNAISISVGMAKASNDP